MLNIGITGQSGFIGTHLFNKLMLYQNRFSIIPFRDEYFESTLGLERFVSECDVIIHLAALNRHADAEVLYKTNLKLIQSLISALETTKSKPHVIFSSSIQEEVDNKYGASKKAGRQLLSEWARQQNANFSGLLLPNVFGPFGAPFYNSVVASFCFQLTHGETPKIDVDADLKLIYIDELVDYIVQVIDSRIGKISNNPSQITKKVQHTTEKKVSDILALLIGFVEKYMVKGHLPNLKDSYVRNMFNTFVCFIDHDKYYPFKLTKHSDARGSFVEILKLSSGGQVSFSTTAPGVTRGDHYHTRKVERFAVINGQARIELRRIGTTNKQSFLVDGDQPSFIDMPIWHTHNITNVGADELFTIFWINEYFDSDDPDTYFEKV